MTKKNIFLYQIVYKKTFCSIFYKVTKKRMLQNFFLIKLSNKNQNVFYNVTKKTLQNVFLITFFLLRFF
jgi:hypothetical protein